MNRIQDLRREANMKQSDLAAALAVTRQAISKWETGVVDLNTDLIAKMCELFSCSADYLLGLSSRREPELSALDAQLLAAYHTAPPEIRRIVDTALDPYTEKKEAAVG